MTLRPAPFRIVSVLTVAAIATAQEPAGGDVPELRMGYSEIRARGDVTEILGSGGVRYVDPRSGLDIRADRAIFALDQEEGVAGLREAREAEGSLPRRDAPLPDARRAFDEQVLRERLRAFLTAARREPTAPPTAESTLDAFRSIYLEGDVAVVQGGVETMRASSMYYSAVDDRAVLRDVTLRLTGQGTDALPMVVTVRAPELVRQGGRIVGRGVSVTTCPAGVPQWEVFSDEIEVLERGEEFEIRSRGNALAFSRTSVLPIPNQTWFTGEQTSFPIKSAQVGLSGREGPRVRIVVGSTLNDLGGSIHEAITGRPADEFRGQWRLGLGWTEARGFPFDADLEYGAADLYRGRTRAFALDDKGENIRDIRNYIDGTPIDDRGRWLAQTENRIAFGEATTLDLTWFDASDPAVYSEFYQGSYYSDELPESSVHARHAVDNLLVTGTARWNSAGFSYGSGRQLEERFVEELPFVTVDWFAEPLAELPFDSSLLLTSSTSAGMFRSNYDDRFAGGVDDDTWRLDQEVELAAPVLLDPVTIRPYTGARYTWYDATPTEGAADRVALQAGLEIGSRFSRTWRWLTSDGEAVGMRHALFPTIRYDETWLVEGEDTELFRFDETDDLSAGSNIRVGLLQQFLQSSGSSSGRRVSEFAWIDLAQNVKPDPDRDNDGHVLGLFEFECILRPHEDWLGIPDVQFVVEGEQDWNEDELRTFNNVVTFRTGDISWLGEYRTDRTEEGIVGYGVMVPIRRRWEVSGRSQYDLDRSQSLNYIARLTRRDLNWTLSLEVGFDAVTDDTSLRVLFEPAFGGLFRGRTADWFQSVNFGAPNYTAY